MAWTSPRTWVSGETLTAALMNTHVRDNLKAIGDPWTSYTPTISNVTTSGVVAKYVPAGKFITVRFKFALTATPSGTVTLSMPVTASTAWGTGQQYTVGSITGLRQGVGYHIGSIYQNSSTTVAFQVGGGSASTWNATNPAAWANTDIWSGTFTCEAA